MAQKEKSRPPPSRTVTAPVSGRSQLVSQTNADSDGPLGREIDIFIINKSEKPAATVFPKISIWMWQVNANQGDKQTDKLGLQS